MTADRLIDTPDFFPSLINAMSDGFVLRSVDGTIIDVNASFCRMIGYERSEIIGQRPPHDWWADEERDRMAQTASRYLAGVSSDDDLLFKRKSGERFPVAVTSAPLRDADGQIIAYVGTVKDMTERNRHQRQLAFQANLINEIRAGVIATDDDGVITLWNRGAEDLFGWQASEVIGVDIRNVLPGVGGMSLTGEALMSLRRGTPVEGEYLAMRRDGSTFPVFITDAPILDRAGNLTGIVAVSVNISERRRSEQRRSAQFEVARVLAEADELSDGIQQVLSAIGTNLGWVFGGYWARDESHDVLRCAETWRSPDLGEHTLTPGLTDDWSFSYGEGMLGRIWQTGDPIWVEDIPHTDTFIRSAEASESGFRSWIAFPVVGRRGVLGAIEFFCQEKRRPEPELLSLVTSFGRQVGQFAERKRAESALRESEDRFRIMADHAPVLLWVAGPDGEATWFNRVWLDFRGRSLEEEIGSGWLEGLHPDDFERSTSVYSAALRSREPYSLEYRMRRYDGSYCWLLSSGVPRIAPDGAFEGYVGSCLDITDRKRAEEDQRFLSEATRILASSLDFKTTLSSLAALISANMASWCVVRVIGADGSVEHSIVSHRDPERAAWAHEIQQRFPVTANAARGTPNVFRTGLPELYPVVTDEDLHRFARGEEHLELLRRVGCTSTMIVPIIARDRVRGTITFMSSDEDRRFTDSDLDTALHLAGRAAIAIENALLYAEARQASRERDQFLAVAAHELRSPLTSMKGFSQLLLRRAEQESAGPEWIRGLKTIDSQVNRVAGLVSRLLDVSRIAENHLNLEVEDVDMADVLRDAVSEAQLTAEAHSIVLVISDDPLTAEVDRSRIEQVLSNLIDNAVKYSPADSQITVSVAADTDSLSVSVRDNGLGIDPDARQRLFNRFYRGTRTARNSSEGLGLGLYVARGIVEAHGGTISVESVPGEGSVFTVTIPRRQPHERPGRE
jgi:PAS domain S-box-containing protein